MASPLNPRSIKFFFFLSPIAPHPDLATIPEETKKVLERLANMPDVFVGVISGRSVNNVREMVGIEGITYAGNHGLEIIHPDGTKVPEIPRNISQLPWIRELICNLPNVYTVL